MLEHEELGTAELVRVRLDELFIDESWNARREGLDKEELAELVADIESQGLLQPIIVRQLEDGRYALVAGFLRAAACRQIDEAMVLDCKLLQTSDDEDEAELEAYHANLSENLKRKALKPWEIADVLHRIREKRPDLPGRELSRSVGLRYSYCAQLLEMRSRAHPDLWAIFQKFGRSYPHGIRFADIVGIVRFARDEQLERWTALVESRTKSNKPRRIRRRRDKDELERYLEQTEELEAEQQFRDGVRYGLRVALGRQLWPSKELREDYDRRHQQQHQHP